MRAADLERPFFEKTIEADLIFAHTLQAEPLQAADDGRAFFATEFQQSDNDIEQPAGFFDRFSVELKQFQNFFQDDPRDAFFQNLDLQEPRDPAANLALNTFLVSAIRR